MFYDLILKSSEQTTYSCDHNAQKCDIHRQLVIYLFCSTDLSNCNIALCIITYSVLLHIISVEHSRISFLCQNEEKKKSK